MKTVRSKHTYARSRGFTLCQLVATIGVMAVMAGLMVRGGLWLRYQADIAMLTSRAQNLGTALHLYYQKHRTFPCAFPAHLEQDLAPYVSDEELFTCPSNPAARAAPLNTSYVTPVQGYEHAYVLGMDSRYDENTAVVLYSSWTTEVVEKLPVFLDDEPFMIGNRAANGLLTLGSGSTVQINASTNVTVANCFRSPDGTAFNILKLDKGVDSAIQLSAADTDIIEVASHPGLVFLRNGTAHLDVVAGASADTLTTSTESGEVRVVGRRTASAARETEEEDDSPSALLSGRVNINPTNDTDFRFRLRQPDGSMITRTDLVESNRQLEYEGPVTWVLFRPRGNGNQNSLTLNGEVYPLQNERLYVLVGADLTLHLYNDKKLQKGNAMGRWWLDSIEANSGYVFPLSWDEDELPPDADSYEEYYDNATGVLGTTEEDPATGDSGTAQELTRQTVRTLSRGFYVPTGRSLTVTRPR